VWRSFLFACNTGLRWCDIYALRFSSVDIENSMLNLIQQKVKDHSSKAVLHLNLNKNALSLLKKYIGKPNEKVFQLPTYNYSLRLLDHIVKDAGIEKHITFHCGRHSFITEHNI
jgi:integrase